ncbi:MAG TPA: hypothetical protein ENI87_06900 [bacterium]|nr:hypothetical protein [bacterium]
MSAAPIQARVCYAGLRTLSDGYDATVREGAPPPLYSPDPLGDPALFGTAIAFPLSTDESRLSPSKLLRLVEPDFKPRRIVVREARLVELINQRARELPLPAACPILHNMRNPVPCQADLLTRLTVFTKCTNSVWLLRRAPSLAHLADITRPLQIVLPVPPGFGKALVPRSFRRKARAPRNETTPGGDKVGGLQ